MDSERLSATFVELADTLVGDFDALDFLHLLTTRCTELLDVTAAGVLLADAAGDLRVMAASSEQVRLLELFQLQNDQGPCLDCYRSGGRVSVPDLAAVAARWPQFTGEAQRRGFTMVVALPMRLRREILGALNLFSTGPGLDPAEIQIAQALADVATIGILQHRAQRQADTEVTQLQTALTSRVLIEQAKGILAERLGIAMEEAFSTLRGHARAHRRHLTELAQAVVAGTEDVTVMSVHTPSARPRPDAHC
jgi:GAF domain-containing protein